MQTAFEGIEDAVQVGPFGPGVGVGVGVGVGPGVGVGFDTWRIEISAVVLPATVRDTSVGW